MIKKGNYFLETITRMEKVARIIITMAHKIEVGHHLAHLRWKVEEITIGMAASKVRNNNFRDFKNRK